MPETITSQLAPKSDNRIILQMDTSLYLQNLSACMQAFDNAEDVDLDTDICKLLGGDNHPTVLEDKSIVAGFFKA